MAQWTQGVPKPSRAALLKEFDLGPLRVRTEGQAAVELFQAIREAVYEDQAEAKRKGRS